MPDSELLHLVARATTGARPFEHRRACADLWTRLARTFDLVACVLMPNHLHVLAHVEDDVATRTFAQVLAAFRRRVLTHNVAPIEFEWEPLPRPGKVQHDRRHIARTVRYIHLNPVRAGLCDDPVEWEWSTHRDWLGAVAQPCVDASRWARAMGRRPATCAEWLHEYVSTDASVRRAMPLADPRPFLEHVPRDASIDTLATAVTHVLRSACTSLAEFGSAERRLFLLSAARWTRYRAPELARHVHCHETSVRRAMRLEAKRTIRADAGVQPGVRAEAPARDIGACPHDIGTRMHGSDSLAANGSGSPANGACARPDRSRLLSGDELRAMALVLADHRLLTRPLRGATSRRRYGELQHVWM